MAGAQKSAQPAQNELSAKLTQHLQATLPDPLGVYEGLKTSGARTPSAGRSSMLLAAVGLAAGPDSVSWIGPPVHIVATIITLLHAVAISEWLCVPDVDPTRTAITGALRCHFATLGSIDHTTIDALHGTAEEHLAAAILTRAPTTPDPVELPAAIA